MQRGQHPVGRFRALLQLDAIAAHCSGQKVQDVNKARVLAASIQRSLKGVLQEIVGLDPSMSSTQRARHSVKPKPGDRRVDRRVYRDCHRAGCSSARR
jgi:hypothetical protein